MSFLNTAQSFSPVYKAASQPLPRVTLGAIDRAGTFHFSETFGGAPSDCQDVNAVHYLASSTKLVTTVAVMQCVERGLLQLSQDISRVLPEFEKVKILKGFTEDNEPIFAAAQNPVTLRHLLTHSSGLAYPGMEPLLPKYYARYGLPVVNTTVENPYPVVLLFEPGKQWMYSPGIDWAGVAVERVTSMKLQAYMQRYVFEPVNVTDATFHLEQRPDLQARRAKYWRRANESLEETQQVMPDPIEGELGGGGLYSTVGELLKIYQGILTGRLLQQTTVEHMFQPQLKTTDGLDKPSEYSLPYRNAVYNAIANDSVVNYGLGGLLNLTPVPGGRASCSLTWSGKPNLYWWIDVCKGVAGIYMSQLEPTGDQASVDLFTEFEKFVYTAVATRA